MKTVTSLFRSELHAITAAQRLEQAGIPRAQIDIWSTPHNLAPLLEDDGLSRADAYAYTEGVIRGGTVVIVKCGAPHIDEVVSILDQEGVLDLNEQQGLWRAEGWEGAKMAGVDRADEIPHGRVRIHGQPMDPGAE